MYTFNSSTWKTKACRCLWFQDQPLYSESQASQDCTVRPCQNQSINKNGHCTGLFVIHPIFFFFFKAGSCYAGQVVILLFFLPSAGIRVYASVLTEFCLLQVIIWKPHLLIAAPGSEPFTGAHVAQIKTTLHRKGKAFQNSDPIYYPLFRMRSQVLIGWLCKHRTPQPW